MAQSVLSGSPVALVASGGVDAVYASGSMLAGLATFAAAGSANFDIYDARFNPATSVVLCGVPAVVATGAADATLTFLSPVITAGRCRLTGDAGATDASAAPFVILKW